MPYANYLQKYVGLFPKRHLPRQPETSTEHLFFRTDQPHIMDLQFNRCIPGPANPVLGRDRVPQFLGDAVADVDVVVDFVVGVAGETVDVDFREAVFLLLGVAGEEGFVTGVDTWEGIEEVDGCGREVHDVVVEHGGPSV